MFQKLSKIIIDVPLAYGARTRFTMKQIYIKKHVLCLSLNAFVFNVKAVRERTVIKEEHHDCSELEDLIGDIIRGNLKKTDKYSTVNAW